jgi:hypothetical protein
MTTVNYGAMAQRANAVAQAMGQRGLTLICLGAGMYLKGVRFDEAKTPRETVKKDFDSIIEALNYGRSTSFGYTSAAFKLAAKMSAQYKGDDADIWQRFNAATTAAEAGAILVAWVKTELKAADVPSLYAALNPAKESGDKKLPGLAKAVETAIKKRVDEGQAPTADDIRAAMAVLNAALAELTPKAAPIAGARSDEAAAPSEVAKAA